MLTHKGGDAKPLLTDLSSVNSNAAVFRCVCVLARWSGRSRGGVKVATMVSIVLCAGVVSWATMVALHWWLVAW